MDAQHDTTKYAVSRHKFDSIINLRDVGKTINQITGQKLIAEGQLFRSARPDDATLSDQRRLRDDYGIKTIIDLRTKSEHAKQARKRQADFKNPVFIQPNDVSAEPIKIPGIDYLEVNITGKGFERSLLRQLSVWSFLKFIFLLLFGYRIEAISILGREVMQPRGLQGLGYDSIDHSGVEIAQAFREFCSSTRYPILIHCTQGKDRTGLLIALILFLLDIPLGAVTYDYCLSGSELLPERESRLAEIKEIGLTEEFAEAPKDWIPRLHQYIQQKYGGVRSYLSSIGVDEETQARLVECYTSDKQCICSQ